MIEYIIAYQQKNMDKNMDKNSQESQELLQKVVRIAPMSHSVANLMLSFASFPDFANTEKKKLLQTEITALKNLLTDFEQLFETN